MNVPPNLADALRQWIRKAEHDLEAANRIMVIEQDCPFDAVCFHCQQACEKYVKCLLTFLGIEAPRTHNLRLLFALIPADLGFPVPVDILAELNPYAVEVRYGDDWIEPRLADAHRALQTSAQVRTFVRDRMPPEVLVRNPVSPNENAR